MAQNITLLGASYSSVPAVTLPKTGGGTAQFDDTTDANATASDIASGKTAYVNGVKLTGTSSGGGGGGSEELDAIIARTISGSYTNSTATALGYYAFAYCSSLTTASFPNVTTIGSYAFYSCSSLTTASFPSANTIQFSGFYGCSSLTTASFPNVTWVGGNAFYSCSRLTTLSFPSANTISSYAFAYCTSLTTVSFPNVSATGGSVFYGCTSLTTASFPNVKSLGNHAFRGCSKLMSVYVLASSVATLGGVSAFASTPMSNSTYTGSFGSIYVPASLVTSYQAATNWKSYSARITSYSV